MPSKTKTAAIPQGIAPEAVPAAAAFPPQVRDGGPCVVPIETIRPSLYNPRTHFDEDALRELADSIAAQGLLQPLVVRPVGECEVVPGRVSGEPRWFVADTDLCDDLGDPNRADAVRPIAAHAQRPYDTAEEAEARAYALEVVAGERRWRACKLAGLTEVPVLVRLLTDDQALDVAIVENLQRKDLDPFEEARGYQMLLDRGVRQAEIAERVNCAQSRISKVTGLLRLPPPVQELIREGKISPSHGQRLLPFAPFPKLCEHLAAQAAQFLWPASRLDSPFENYWELENKGLLKKIYFNTSDAHRELQPTCQGKCPHDAYRKGGADWGFCLRPDHHKEIYNEALAREQEAKRARVEETVAKAKAEGRALPMLGELQNVHGGGTVERLDWKPERHRPAECAAKACPCWREALIDNGDAVPVCIDPKRYRDLEAKRGKERAKTAKAVVEGELGRAREILDNAHKDRRAETLDRIAVLACWDALRQAGLVCTRKAAERMGLAESLNLVKEGRWDYWGKDRKKGDAPNPIMADLERLPVLTVLRLAVEARLVAEADGQAKYGGDPDPETLWSLQWLLAAPAGSRPGEEAEDA